MGNILRNLLFTISIITLAVLASCNNYYYMPSAQHVPLHQEKSELKITGSAGTDTEINSYDAQASYSVTDNVAIMLNTQYAEASSNEWQRRRSGSGHAMELGAGYYLPYADNLVSETFIGGGGGRVLNLHDDGTFSGIGFGKAFVQSQIGFNHRNFDLALGGRFVFINYGEPSFLGFPGEGISNQLTRLHEAGTLVLMEPAITTRIGVENVKLQLQLVLSADVYEVVDFPRSHLNMSAGVYVDF